MTVEEIFKTVFGIPESDVTDSLELKEISSWDSMSHMVLITQIEQEFEIEMTGDEIADLDSVQSVKKVVARHREGK